MERYTMDELTERYNVSTRTIYNWIKEKGLPITQITPQQRWVYKEDLEEWENSFREPVRG
ncbi:helix-turn-helix domain-containing protein [Flagellimonas iocasae]|uniref:Helix-turn-helix domain-containing protein n=1 Tax=Flagellimonas iocasae TaxID=2055905 RepID=A0ABW4XWE4_9FLAO